MPSLLPPICRGSETIMGSTHLLGAFPHMQKHSPGPAFHAYEEIGRQLGARDEQQQTLVHLPHRTAFPGGNLATSYHDPYGPFKDHIPVCHAHPVEP